MQVEIKRSKILRSSNRTRRDKYGKIKSKSSIRLAGSLNSQGSTNFIGSCQLLVICKELGKDKKAFA